ncbi:ficolin-2 [Elysia marginata]|uniref:Ficolin-2 n=1 Tax=Elysia marginata TaxID=1093978 RepID=A0AAV4JFZ7_9GAST|nr:ficolin-2 [Elysia marginata]
MDCHYEFLRMPFGMMNSGATLTRAVKKLLCGIDNVVGTLMTYLSIQRPGRPTWRLWLKFLGAFERPTSLSDQLSLEFTLSRNKGNLLGISPSCGVLFCRTSSPGQSDDNQRNITSMSLYKAVSQRQYEPKYLKRLATVSSSKPDLERVSNGMKMNGSVKNGQATLRVELSQQKDCLADYTCEVQEVDYQGKERITSSQLLQQLDQIPDNGFDEGLTSALFMRLFSLVQGLDVKVTAVENYLNDKLNSVEDQITKKILLFENSLQSKFAIGEKFSERVETKLNLVETKLNSVESELSSVEKIINSVENSCESEALNLQNEMTDKMHSLENSLQSRASSALQKVDDKLGEMKIKLATMDSEAIQQRILNAIKYQVDEHFKIILNATGRTEDALKETSNLITFLTSEYTGFQNIYKANYQSLFDGVSRGMEGVFLQNKKSTNIIKNNLYRFNEDLKLSLGSMASSTEKNVKKTLRSFEIQQSALVGEMKSDLTEFFQPRKCTKYMFPTHNGIYPYYVIYKSDITGLNTPNLLCDTLTDNGGWIVIQKRSTGDVNFYRKWWSYKKGFGMYRTDFWLGLENIHAITRSGRFELRVELEYQGVSTFAVYDRFSVAGEDRKYALSLGSYSGTAGDSLQLHRGMQFSTYDKDHDKWATGNCAVDRTGAWWYQSCADSNLNGKWQARRKKGPAWRTFTSTDAASSTEMKIRRLIIFVEKFNMKFGHPRKDTCSSCDEMKTQLNKDLPLPKITELKAEQELHMRKAQTFL